MGNGLSYDMHNFQIIQCHAEAITQDIIVGERRRPRKENTEQAPEKVQLIGDNNISVNDTTHYCPVGPAASPDPGPIVIDLVVGEPCY